MIHEGMEMMIITLVFGIVFSFWIGVLYVFYRGIVAIFGG